MVSNKPKSNDAFLPVDILRSIFLHAAHTPSQSAVRFFNHYNPYVALTLSHVCLEWREIAHQTALLWTHIHPDYIRLAEHCLMLNKDADLDIVFIARWTRCCKRSRPEVARGLPPNLTQLIRLNMPRIRNLEIVSDVNDIPHIITAIAETGFAAARLQTCHIDYLRQEGEDHGSILNDVLANYQAPGKLFFYPLPSLKAVSWSVLSPPVTSDLWNNLCVIRTVFLLQPLPIQEWISILSKSPSLERLELRNSIAKDSIATNLQLVVLPRLQRLNIAFPSSEHLTVFLNTIRLPQIAKIVFEIDSLQQGKTFNSLIQVHPDILNLIYGVGALSLTIFDHLITVSGYIDEATKDACYDDTLFDITFLVESDRFVLQNILDSFHKAAYLSLRFPSSSPQLLDASLGVSNSITTLDASMGLFYIKHNYASLTGWGCLPNLKRMLISRRFSSLDEEDIMILKGLIRGEWQVESTRFPVEIRRAN